MKKFYLENSEREVIAEGVIFSNGSLAMSWLSKTPSHAIYGNLFELERIHPDLKISVEEEERVENEFLDYKSIFEVGQADNGWVVREYEYGSTIVASEDCAKSEHEAFLNFIWALINKYGPSDSKYSPERLMPMIVPGSDCTNGHLEPEVVREKVLDHLDYCLRFLQNTHETKKTEDLLVLEKEIEELFDTLMSKVFATIPA